MVKNILKKEKADIKIIAKLETREAIQNMDSLLKANKYFLLDRGDLAGEMGIANVPKVQAQLIRKCRKLNKKLIIATQFLISMVNQPVPHISEVGEIYTVIKSGVSGIQLSEETAIGKYPYECINIINTLNSMC